MIATDGPTPAQPRPSAAARPAQAQAQPGPLRPSPKAAQAQPRLGPSPAQARSGNLEIWDTKRSQKNTQENIKNKNYQNQNSCRPKSRRGLD